LGFRGRSRPSCDQHVYSRNEDLKHPKRAGPLQLGILPLGKSTTLATTVFATHSDGCHHSHFHLRNAFFAANRYPILGFFVKAWNTAIREDPRSSDKRREVASAGVVSTRVNNHQQQLSIIIPRVTSDGPKSSLIFGR
jgi:hypothetical protein